MWLNVMNINDQINYQKFIIVDNLYDMNRFTSYEPILSYFLNM